MQSKTKDVVADATSEAVKAIEPSKPTTTRKRAAASADRSPPPSGSSEAPASATDVIEQDAQSGSSVDAIENEPHNPEIVKHLASLNAANAPFLKGTSMTPIALEADDVYRSLVGIATPQADRRLELSLLHTVVITTEATMLTYSLTRGEQVQEMQVLQLQVTPLYDVAVVLAGLEAQRLHLPNLTPLNILNYHYGTLRTRLESLLPQADSALVHACPVGVQDAWTDGLVRRPTVVPPTRKLHPGDEVDLTPSIVHKFPDATLTVRAEACSLPEKGKWISGVKLFELGARLDRPALIATWSGNFPAGGRKTTNGILGLSSHGRFFHGDHGRSARLVSTDRLPFLDRRGQVKELPGPDLSLSLADRSLSGRAAKVPKRKRRTGGDRGVLGVVN